MQMKIKILLLKEVPKETFIP